MKKSEDWENEIPEDGEPCPECNGGTLETQRFGKETWAWCVGLNGVKLEDADETDEEGAGCGWEHIFKPNAETSQPDEL